MNKYLLLRDNKESGPYTVEELIAKGLKPYDLVWLDGKSAAWRYPSEIADFKGFAPAVEEQPYDRFYKKKPDHYSNQELSNTIIQPKQETTAATTVEAIVVTRPPVEKAGLTRDVSTKKIYVTLPAQSRTATASNTGAAVTATNSDAVAEQKANEEAAAKLNEQFARLREEKIKQAESIAVRKPAIAVKDTYQPTFSTLADKAITAQPEQLAPPPPRSGNRNRILLGSMAAACLLLVGVIIGLVISNSRQQKDSAAIEKLVQQIRDRDSKKTQTASLPAQQQPSPVQEPESVPPGQDIPSSLQSEPEEQAKTQNIATPVNRKAQPAFTHPKKDNGTITEEPQQQPVKVITAVVSNSKPEEAASARKNIHQLVDVEANKYKTGVLGGISELRLTVSNNSLYPLDQVEVEVRYLGPEKRVIKTQAMLFNDVAAGEQKTLDVPQSNRGVTVDYTITRINSKALGLAHVSH